MDPIGSFTGLATGIDFRSLVDAIIQAESRPALLLEQRKAELETKATAWGDVELRVRSVFDRASELADPSFFAKFKTSVGSEGVLSVSAGAEAVAGTFSAEVLQMATREKVGSDVFQDRTSSLGLSGEFVVAGQSVQVAAIDTLDDVAQAINAAASRTKSGGVTATVVGTSGGGYRMVLTAAQSGAAGIGLADGTAGLLRNLGFLDGQTSIKHQTSDGAKSDGFKSATADVGTLLGLSSPPASASVGIGALGVTIDLATQSLDEIAQAINAAASGAGSSITAQVVAEQDASGSTVRRLDIGGTTAFVDANGILETLGVLEAGRGAVAQQVASQGFTAGGAVTPASGGTLLTDLWVGGAAGGVQPGDTLTLQGTHGDGTTFTKTVVIGGGDTFQDLVDELDSATDGFGAGTRTATASVVDGALVVTDDVGGGSRLSLSIISHNEGGARLDFGDFTTVAAGRDREIVAGSDAEILVDGQHFVRSTNSISDVVEGVTLNLSGLSDGGPVTVDVSQDVDAVVKGIEAFVKSYNAVSEFVLAQFTGVGAEEGESKRPLSGDRLVRTVRDRMRAALQAAVSESISGFGGLRELGIAANRNGLYDIDLTKLREAVEGDPVGVQRLFIEFGSGSVSALDYVSAGKNAQAGTYDVVIDTAATQATVAGVGFAGAYVDDGTADVLRITDSSTQSVYDAALTNGMSLAQIVDALNAQFDSATARRLEASTLLASDAVGTQATDTTLLQDLFAEFGNDLGIADGDAFTISGTRDDGSSFLTEWQVQDVSTQTLGTLRQQIANVVGADAAIDVQNGRLTATAIEDGSSSFTLAVSSDNAGGGTFSMGALAVSEAGRGVAAISAAESGGQLTITHDEYGSDVGFGVAFIAGGTDGSASLGLTTGDYAGIDVVGTIGGYAATGTGRVLTGAEGTAVEGLIVSYASDGLGAVGSLTYSRGIASVLEAIADGYLDGGETSIQGIKDRLDTQKRGITDRIERFEERLQIRAENLTKRFTALEEAMAQAQQEMSWLQAQLGSLLPTQSA
jgi:flagellar hook-associated protein 2